MNRQQGFSLVEVIAAMVILTIGVLGLAASARAVARLTSEGGQMSGAAAAASSKFEELRASSACTTMAGGTGTAADGYNLSWTVSTSGLLKQITLTVSYSTGTSTRSTAFVTYISCAPQAS